MVLNTQPTSNVTITLTSNDTTAATVTSPLTFTSGNWSTPQTVTITGVNDADAVSETVTISHALSGGGYNAVTMTNFTATMTDDDVFISGDIFNGKVYLTVTSPDTGRVWLDRNLGATQVAASSTDSAAYGDSYQWGRATDGHELRSATTATTATATLATTISPGVNAFVTNSTAPYDWTSADSAGSSRVSAWNSGGANDICPSGFSVPTEAEITADTISATTTDITNGATAFSSFLKIPVAGYRNRVVGALRDVGSYAFLWSRSAYGAFGRGLGVGGGGADFYSLDRANGFSVRCIKD
ncbi:extracellular nuclease, putative [uncultured Candidatus Thioglobus sp.]|nr:extracellular nuclease, putative [uncultured Candidatus Thioglobus sp.]